MTDFIGSFKKGLEAANLAAQNNAEIESVFATLNEQLSSVTQGKVKVRIETVTEPFDLLSLSPKEFYNRKTYTAITACNPLAATRRSEELARWKVSESGYPCRVGLPGQEIYCQDRTALENALAQLLATPAAGKALQRVMNQKLKEGGDQAP